MQEKANPRPQGDPFQAKHSSRRPKQGRGSSAEPWPPVADAAPGGSLSWKGTCKRLNGFPFQAETQRKGKRERERAKEEGSRPTEK